MGMDAYRFEVTRVLPAQEALKYFKGNEYNESLKGLDVDLRLLEWMKKNGINKESIAKIPSYDWVAWFEKNPQYKDYDFGNYDLSEESQKKWVEVISPDGKTTIINDGFILKNVECLYVEVKTIGYMRKPFRHSEQPSYSDGDTLVLTVTNFSDKGENALEELKKIDANQADDCNIYIFDSNQLEKLKEYSYDEQQFKSSFVEDWKPNHFVLFNW